MKGRAIIIELGAPDALAFDLLARARNAESPSLRTTAERTAHTALMLGFYAMADQLERRLQPEPR